MTDEELLEELSNPTIIGITLWYRCNNSKGVYEYNNFERTRDNHLLFSVDNTFERPKLNPFVENGFQKYWKNQKWKYSLGKLNTKTHKIIEEGELI